MQDEPPALYLSDSKQTFAIPYLDTPPYACVNIQLKRLHYSPALQERSGFRRPGRGRQASGATIEVRELRWQSSLTSVGPRSPVHELISLIFVPGNIISITPVRGCDSLSSRVPQHTQSALARMSSDTISSAFVRQARQRLLLNEAFWKPLHCFQIVPAALTVR